MELDKAARELLPETINLHSMIVEGFEFNSEPTFVNFGALTDHLVKEEQTTTWDLKDPINKIEVRISITKTVHHKLVDA